jgi:hypothetical protein
MKLFIVLSLASAYGDECLEVGLRYAKLQSICDGETCRYIRWNSDRSAILPYFLKADGEVVRCSEARAFVDNAPSVAIPEAQILGMVRETIVPALQLFLFVEQPPGPEAVKAMGAILSPSLRDHLETEELTELLGLINSVTEQAASSSYNADTYLGEYAVVAHFIFDFLSIVEVDFFDWSRLYQLPGLTMAAIRSRPGYRDPYELEAFWEPGTSSVDLALEYAKTLDDIGTSGRVTDSHAERIARFHALWSPQAAAEAILASETRRILCQRLPELAIRNPIFPPGLFRKAVLTVMELCEDESMFVRLTVSVLLSRKLDLFETVPVGNIEKALQLLTVDNINWAHFNPIDAEISQWPVFVVQLLNAYIKESNAVEFLDSVAQLRPSSAFSSFEEFRIAMTGLGRAIGFGLQINFKGTLGALPLSQTQKITLRSGLHADYVFGTLEEVRNKDSLSSTEKARVLLDYVYSPLYFVRKGIRDSMGPLGLNCYSEPEWLFMIQKSLYLPHY